MHYYIIDNKILRYDKELSQNLYSYPKLTDEQSEFYELHNCSVSEVINLKLDEIYIPLLEDLKIQRIEFYSQLAMDMREQLIPNYKLINAGLGIYGDAILQQYQSVIQQFRAEFYRLKNFVENAQTIEELNSITDNYGSIL